MTGFDEANCYLLRVSRIRKPNMRIRRVLRSVLDHPFLLSTSFSLLIICKYAPSLFNLLSATFPVIIFTAIFLGIILIHGEPNLPETRNARNPYRSNIRLTGLVRTRGRLPKPESDKSNESESESETGFPLDEIHPLLESGSVSKEVTSDSESESDKGETEKEKEKDERKAVAWTADDQKALQQIGSLEIERNTRLEEVIARRKAVRKILERDLIDLEGFDASQFQIQPVIAPRRNPFDLPDEEEIPGSAPSVLLPVTKNPFDFPLDEHEENETLNPNSDTKGSNVNVNVNVHVNNSVNNGLANHHHHHHHYYNNNNNNNEFGKNALFRRYESFTIGEQVEWGNSRANHRFKPFFTPEKLDFEEGSESLDKETSLTHDADDDVSSESDESSSEEGRTKEREEELTEHESNNKENDDDDDDSSSDEEVISNSEGLNEKTLNSGVNADENEEDTDSESNVQHLGKEEEPIVADPVYDSSPTAHEKPSLLVEALFKNANNEGDSEDSKEKKEEGPSESVVWVAPSLAIVDEIESRSRELSEIRETDIIGPKISEIREDLVRPITPMIRDKDC